MSSHSTILSHNQEHGFAESFRSLLHAALRYGHARLRLFYLEGREVLHRGLMLAALAVGAVGGVLMAYGGFMIALVLWIARTWWGGDVLPAIMLVAFGHLLLAIGAAVWLIHAARHAGIFHATLKEFKEDQQWLHENQTSRH
jgi:uncharacterized membrane protein YqjE